MHLGISGIGFLEGFNAVFPVSSTPGDKEPPGQKVIRPIQLDDDVDLIRGTNPGHLGNVSQCGPIQVVVPGHVNHHRPFGLFVVFSHYLSHPSDF